MVRVVVRPWRVRQESRPPALTPSRLAWLLLQPAGHLSEADGNALEDYLHANPMLARGYQLKTRFHTLLAEHDATALDQWLQAAEASGLPPFCTLARSFRQDYAAIVAALTTPSSTGQCEGQICRVKLSKRLGYGRAKLDLLCQRILHRMVAPMTRAGCRRQGQQAAAA